MFWFADCTFYGTHMVPYVTCAVGLGPTYVLWVYKLVIFCTFFQIAILCTTVHRPIHRETSLVFVHFFVSTLFSLLNIDNTWTTIAKVHHLNHGAAGNGESNFFELFCLLYKNLNRYKNGPKIKAAFLIQFVDPLVLLFHIGLQYIYCVFLGLLSNEECPPRESTNKGKN